MVIDVDALERVVVEVTVGNFRYTWPRDVAEYFVCTRDRWLKPDPLPFDRELSTAGRMEIMGRQVMQRPVEKAFDPYFDPVPEGEAWLFYSRKHGSYIVRPRGFGCLRYYSSRHDALVSAASYADVIVYKGDF